MIIFFSHMARAVEAFSCVRAMKALGIPVTTVGPMVSGEPLRNRIHTPDHLVDFGVYTAAEIQALAPDHRGIIWFDYDDRLSIDSGNYFYITPFDTVRPVAIYSHIPLFSFKIPPVPASPMHRIGEWLPQATDAVTTLMDVCSPRELDLCYLAESRSPTATCESVLELCNWSNILYAGTLDACFPMNRLLLSESLCVWIDHDDDLTVPRSVFDAMAMGSVVLTKPTTAMARLFLPYEHYWPVSDMAADIAQSIKVMIQDARRRNQIRDLAYDAVANNHLFEHRVWYLKERMDAYLGN